MAFDTRALLAVFLAPAIAAQVPRQRPSLVVVVVVDQLRADYLGHWGDQWRGGLARFWSHGTVFEHGRQDHASTETAPGHSTILSGRHPTHTGIVLNARGVPDASSPVLGIIDTVGASPRRFRGTTLYDWMLARDPGARVLSVSRKDRGAILPVGRARGDVYWYAGGQFTTSKYYADTLPTWVRAPQRYRLVRKPPSSQRSSPLSVSFPPEGRSEMPINWCRCSKRWQGWRVVGGACVMLRAGGVYHRDLGRLNCLGTPA